MITRLPFGTFNDLFAFIGIRLYLKSIKRKSFSISPLPNKWTKEARNGFSINPERERKVPFRRGQWPGDCSVRFHISALIKFYSFAGRSNDKLFLIILYVRRQLCSLLGPRLAESIYVFTSRAYFTFHRRQSGFRSLALMKPRNGRGKKYD